MRKRSVARARSKTIAILLLLLLFAGCSMSAQGGEVSTVVLRQAITELEEDPVPGTTSGVWVEPMVQQTCKPGAIDDHGIYYRKPHCTLEEIRPGKYQKVQFPNARGQYPRN